MQTVQKLDLELTQTKSVPKQSPELSQTQRYFLSFIGYKTSFFGFWTAFDSSLVRKPLGQFWTLLWDSFSLDLMCDISGIKGVIIGKTYQNSLQSVQIVSKSVMQVIKFNFSDTTGKTPGEVSYVHSNFQIFLRLWCRNIEF